jgi:hypothetical protein
MLTPICVHVFVCLIFRRDMSTQQHVHPRRHSLSIIGMLILKSGRGFHVIGEREPAERHADQGLHFRMALVLRQLQAPPRFLPKIERLPSHAPCQALDLALLPIRRFQERQKYVDKLAISCDTQGSNIDFFSNEERRLLSSGRSASCTPTIQRRSLSKSR